MHPWSLFLPDFFVHVQTEGTAPSFLTTAPLHPWLHWTGIGWALLELMPRASHLPSAGCAPAGFRLTSLFGGTLPGGLQKPTRFLVAKSSCAPSPGGFPQSWNAAGEGTCLAGKQGPFKRQLFTLTHPPTVLPLVPRAPQSSSWTMKTVSGPAFGPPSPLSLCPLLPLFQQPLPPTWTTPCPETRPRSSLLVPKSPGGWVLGGLLFPTLSGV